MPSIVVLDIPKEVSKDVLEAYFADPKNGGGEVEYIIYPFQPSKALISFKRLSVLNNVFSHTHVIGSSQLQVMPLPLQVYGTITAEINPQIMSQIPNKTDFFIELNEEFGVKVQYSGSSSYLVGSWQQLQAAQTRVWDVHHQLQQQGWAQLMSEVGSPPSALELDVNQSRTNGSISDEQLVNGSRPAVIETDLDSVFAEESQTKMNGRNGSVTSFKVTEDYVDKPVTATPSKSQSSLSSGECDAQSLPNHPNGEVKKTDVEVTEQMPSDDSSGRHSGSVSSDRSSVTRPPAPRIELTTQKVSDESPKHFVISAESNFFMNRHFVDDFDQPNRDLFSTSPGERNHQSPSKGKSTKDEFDFSLRKVSPNRSSTPTSPFTKTTSPTSVPPNMTQLGVQQQLSTSFGDDPFGFDDFAVRPKRGSSSQFTMLPAGSHRDSALRESFHDSTSSDESDSRIPVRQSLRETEFFVNPTLSEYGLNDYAPPLSPVHSTPINVANSASTHSPNTFHVTGAGHVTVLNQHKVPSVGQFSPSVEDQISAMSTASDEQLPAGDTLELESDILSYIQEFKGALIQTIQKQNNVRFTSDKCGEFCSLHIVPQPHCQAEQVQHGKDAFVALYQDIFSKIWKEKVTLKPEHISDLESLLTIIEDMRKKYDEVSVTLNEETFKEITVIGEEKKIRGVKCDLLMRITEASNAALKGEWAHKAKLVREKSKEIDDVMSTDEFGEYKCKMGDVIVVIYQSDIAREETDVIVNSAQNDLANIGRVASAICMMGGTQFQEQCNRYVVKHGSLEDGELMFMKAMGKLRCNFIINAVGPMWFLYSNKDDCQAMLQRTFVKCLKCANETLQAQSVSLPTISTGINGVPLDVCAKATYCAILEFLREKRPEDPLNEIHLVNTDNEATTMMKVVFQQMLETDNPGQVDFWSDIPSDWRKPSSVEESSKVSDHMAGVGVRKRTSSQGSRSSKALNNSTSSDQFAEFANFRATRDQGQNERVVQADVHIGRSQSLYTTPVTGEQDLVLRRRLSSEAEPLPGYQIHDTHGSHSAFHRSNEALVVSLPSNSSLNSSSTGNRSLQGGDIDTHRRRGSRRVIRNSASSDEIGTKLGDRRLITLKNDDADSSPNSRESPIDTQQSHDSDESEVNERDIPILLHVEKDKRLDRNRKSQDLEKDKEKDKDKSKKFGLSSLRSSFKRRKSKDKGKYSAMADDRDEDETAVGDQPKGGKMKKDIIRNKRLPGMKDDSQGILVISYELPSGVQKSYHPTPGKPYHAIFRTAFLPYNKEGKEIAKLLEKAFDAGLIFTIGKSDDTGDEDVLTWTDIPHKTSIHGGPENHGYPDIGYLQRVRIALAAKGIK